MYDIAGVTSAANTLASESLRQKFKGSDRSKATNAHLEYKLFALNNHSLLTLTTFIIFSIVLDKQQPTS